MSLFEGRNEVPVTKKGLFMVPNDELYQIRTFQIQCIFYFVT